MKCQDCGEQVDELRRYKLGRQTLKLCEDCLEIRQEQDEVSAEAESVTRDMMEYSGR